MGKYKNLSKSLLFYMHKSLISVIKSLKSNPSDEIFAYLILCLYEFIIAIICVRYKSDLGVIDEKNLLGAFKIIVDNEYNINKNVTSLLFKMHFSEEDSDSLNTVLSKFVYYANTLRHSFNRYHKVVGKMLDIFYTDSFNLLITTFITKEYEDVSKFVLDKDLIKRLSDEVKDEEYIRIKCIEELESYMFIYRHSSLGEAKQYLISRNICSEVYAEHFINEYLNDYIIVTDEK